MELRAGYKQSEVGVIPEDWNVKTAIQVCDLVVDCKNRTPPIVENSEFAVVRTPNVRNGKFIREELRFTDAKSFDLWTMRAIPQIGDVLITREAPLGEVCLVPKDIKVCLGQRMMLYRPNKKITESSFLMYALLSTAVKSNLLKKIGGSTVGHARVDDIQHLEIPLPPLLEQRAIATALSDVDALLDSLEQLIAKKRDLKQAAMQQLLTGRQRLEGFSGAWEVKRLEGVAEIIGGSTPKTSVTEYWNGNVKWCTPTDITKTHGKTIFETERNITTRGLRSIGGQLLPIGSLLLCTRATIGELKIAGTEICTNQGFKSLVCGSGTSNEFLYYKLLTMKSKMIEKAFGSTFLEISKSNLSALEVTLPPLLEQQAIATILSDMDAEIAALEARRDKTKALKHGMMQELLTGKTRLV